MNADAIHGGAGLGEGTVADGRCSRRRFVEMAGLAAAATLFGVAAVRDAQADDAQAQVHEVTDMDGDAMQVSVAVERYGDAWAEHVATDCLLDGGKGLVATATAAQTSPWLYAMVPNLTQVPTVFKKGFSATDLPDPAPQVVFADDDDLRDGLQGTDVPVVDVDCDTFDEMRRSVTLTAQVLGGDAPSKAEAFLKEFDQVLDEVRKATADIETGERPLVLYGDAVYQGHVEGTDSLANEWILAAGGQNANPNGDDADDATYADVMVWNPDIIVTESLDDAEKILNDHDWDDIAAVREGRVYPCPFGLNRWGDAGPELMLQVLWLAGTMYPDLYPADEVAMRIQAFYRTYYGFEASFEDVELILAAQGPAAGKA